MLNSLKGEKVELYRNLNKGKKEGKPFSSVRHGKVCPEYPRFAHVKNCTFTVQPAAQKKIKAGGDKAVHAWVNGTFVSASETALKLPAGFVHVRYNPELEGYFFIASSGKPVTQADEAIMLNGALYCKNAK